MLINTILLLFLFSCNILSYNQHQYLTAKAISIIHHQTYDPMKGTVGFVVLDDSVDVYGVNIYNEDGSLWSTISFKDGELRLPKEGLDIYAFHPDYYLFSLRCVSKTDQYYTVVVNEGKKTLKYIRVNDISTTFQTWEENVLSTFSVGFNEKDNPLMTLPGKGEKIPVDQDNYYHAEKIEGDWLQVKWGDEKHWDYGWIRWRKKDMLIIELFYLC